MQVLKITFRFLVDLHIVALVSVLMSLFSYRFCTCGAICLIDFIIILPVFVILGYRATLQICEGALIVVDRDWRMLRIWLRTFKNSLLQYALVGLTMLYAIALIVDKVILFSCKVVFAPYADQWKEGYTLGITLLSILLAYVKDSTVLLVCIGVGVMSGIILGIIMFSFRYRSGSDRSDSCLGMCDDFAKTDEDEDSYSRKPFVGMLASLVMSENSNRGARYIGVYAPWGYGKTSVRNFLKQRIEKEYGIGAATFVDFAPWEYPEDVDIAIQLYGKLARAFSRLNHCVTPYVLRQYAKILSFRRDSRNAGSLHKAIEFLWGLWFRYVVDEEALIEDLRYVLMREKSKVVVVIDDLERLPSNEVCRIVRFLKANGDIPGITYIILSDENHLNRSIATMVEHEGQDSVTVGADYLKKIIPFRCPLPPITRSGIFNELKKKLEKVPVEHSRSLLSDDDAIDFVLKVISNPRDLAKFINALVLQLAVFKRRDDYNVHMGDLIVITALKEFEPKIYAELPNFYWSIVDQCTGYLYGSTVSKEWVASSLINKRTILTEEDVYELINTRLGVVKKSGDLQSKEDRYTIINPFSNEFVYGYRLRSRYCFSNYFLTSLEDSYLAQWELEEFLQGVMKGVYPQVLLERLNKECRLQVLLYSLEAQEPFKDIEITKNYIDILLQLSRQNLTICELPPEYKNVEWFGGTSVYARVFRCLNFYCRRLQKQFVGGLTYAGATRVGDVLLERVLLNRNNVYVMCELLAVEDRNPSLDVPLEKLFSNEQYQRLVNAYFDAILAFHNDGNLLAHYEMFDMFRAWRISLKRWGTDAHKQAFRVSVKPYLHDSLSVKKILFHFVRQDFPASLKVSPLVAFERESFIEFFDVESISIALSTLESIEKHDIFWLHVIIVMRWCVANSTSDKYFIQHQLTHLEKFADTPDYKELLAKRSSGIV